MRDCFEQAETLFKPDKAIVITIYYCYIGGIMKAFVYAQTVLTEDMLKELKRKTGEVSTKDALYKAVVHYLKCPNAGTE